MKMINIKKKINKKYTIILLIDHFYSLFQIIDHSMI